MKNNKNYKTKYSFFYLLEQSGVFISAIFKNIVKFTWRLVFFLAMVTILFGSIALIVGGYFYFSTVGEIPRLENPEEITLPQDSIIYDVNNQVIGVITSQRRYIVSDNEINDNMKNAIVSIEDERYFNHRGVDFIGIARAVLINYESWKQGGTADVQGASTITQQYTRMIYLNQDDTYERKLKEITLAIQLESKLSKEDILNRYLNTVYFGNGNYGVEAAANYYFNKKAIDLNIVESAILASIINGPTVYDPTNEEGLQKTIDRTNLVLNKMYELGYIDKETLTGYKKEDLKTYLHITPVPLIINQPYYYDFVLKELLSSYTKEEIYTGGWAIYTTLDINKSNIMKNIAIEEIGSTSPSVSMADINPRTGAINAFLGGYDFSVSNFNLATQGKRQPGSSFKPFVLAAAFKQGYRETSTFSNAPLTMTMPDGKIWDVVPDSNANTLEEGIAYSDNAMFARLMLEVKPKPVVDMAHTLGIKSEINEDYAIALGGLTYGVSALEMASAYGTLANNGLYCEPYSIEKIYDSYGDSIYQHKIEEKQAVNTEIAAMMNKSLKNVVEYGTASDSITLDQIRETAGKTGTTDDHADTWFVGYTPNFSAAVWMGYPDSRVPINNIKGERAWGGTFTARIWNEYAKIVTKDLPKDIFPAPQGLVEVPTLAEYPDINQLKKAFNRMRLDYHIVEVIDLNQEQGKILSISKEGELVKLNSDIEIKVVIHRYVVPDFSGLTPYNAAVSNKDYFNLEFEFELDDTISDSRSGTIFYQDIEEGKQVAPGTNIVLTIKFKTPTPETVIKEVPKEYIATDSELYTLKQEVERLQTLIKQLEEENKQLTDENTILKTRIVIKVPNFVGMDIITAQSLAESMGFTVISNGSDKVILQDPPAGTEATTLNLVLTGTIIPEP